MSDRQRLLRAQQVKTSCADSEMVHDQTIVEGSVCAALFLHYTSGD